ncbi:hypothetical protein GR158_12755 [Shinella sp. AETb1-6]|jgi:hypothetical protein|uniref:hypothetical protein n=1 Tax=Shinella TaxID=323620 RepID=UPI00106DDCC2|nr:MULTISPECIES: hypothetical protein [Shinella]MDP9591760.1 hypothetical protein [Shinella zoogloeoides]MCD1266151.1 hypothetical protein [Shinella sumterensis]MXN51994.1 hypothetical protein [Shinella sp. AETb1-6]TFE94757.1 hypothetical protein B5M44_23185 [Shinella sumterensis]WLS08907.1 hypothetical protein Q9314_03805 [Shinella sumterensis]
MFPSAKLSIACFIAILAATPAALAQGLAPVPGSITFNGQPHTKLTKAPVGSTFSHRLRDAVTGHEYIEIYRILPDRSLEIVSRRRYGAFND